MRSRAVGSVLATFAVVAAVAVPTLASGAAKQASVHTVALSHVRYHPGTLSIKRGDTVTWLWQDKGKEHNVTGKGFKSKTMTKGSFSVRFTKAGTFNYHCTIHVSEGMRGSVVVH
jgi:plastocyanin